MEMTNPSTYQERKRIKSKVKSGGTYFALLHSCTNLTRRFVEEGLVRAENVLKTHEDELHTIAQALVDYETLSLDEVRTILSGKPLSRPKNDGEVLRSEAEKAGQTGAIVEGI
jgi:ATP-dependent Zn protease